MEARRILVLTASYGGGHAAASSAIERYYADHTDVDVRVVDFLETVAPNLNVLAKFAYQRSEAFFPNFTGSFEGLQEAYPDNPAVHELKENAFAHVQSLLDEWAPHAVVSLCPLAGGAATEARVGRGYLSISVSLDYRGVGSWVNPGGDLHFVACKETREDLVVRGVPWDRIVVSGIPVAERFSESFDRPVARSALGFLDRYTVLLASTTGSPAEVRDIVKHLLDQGVQVAVVAGNNGRLRRGLETLIESSRFLHVFGYVDDMPRMMCAADRIVGRAGGPIVPEAFASGLPLIVMGPVPGQEIQNVDFLVNYVAGLFARDGDDVLEKVRFLSAHPERLAQMATDAAIM
ncbi:MAG: glycosyltransferase, partial [Actinomycetota bacterium]|nr:glycosyltransferase [Actinomycetota bacterium]